MNQVGGQLEIFDLENNVNKIRIVDLYLMKQFLNAIYLNKRKFTKKNSTINLF